MARFYELARACALVAVAVVLVGSAGCGPTKTTVRGKVTHQGKNLVWGSVTLIGSDGIYNTGKIGPDGGYEIKDVRTGTVKIGVVSTKPRDSGGAKRNPGGGGATALETKANLGELEQVQVPDGWFPIPESAGDPATSGLTGEVRAGKPLDIDVK